MNSNPYVLPALFILCVAALLGCGAWAWLAITRQADTGRHARARAASAEADQFVAELRSDAGVLPREELYTPLDEGWWNVPPPDSAVQAVQAGPEELPGELAGTPPPAFAAAVPTLAVRQPRPVPGVPRSGGVADLGLLRRMRDALLPDAWRPPPPTFTPADPDVTRFDLPAVTDAPQYLAAPQ